MSIVFATNIVGHVTKAFSQTFTVYAPHNSVGQPNAVYDKCKNKVSSLHVCY